MIRHAPAFCLSAGLLLLCQLIAGRRLLPLHGGAAGVWTVCLLAFQWGLVIAYAYARWLTAFFSPPIQKRIHALLLALACLTLLPGIAAPTNPSDSPTSDIVRYLTFSIGLPYLVLAANTPLLSSWNPSVARRDSHFGFVISNLSSAGALIGYPTLIEPFLSVTRQSSLWIIGYIAYAISWVFSAVSCERDWRESASAGLNPLEQTPADRQTANPTYDRGSRLDWILISACGTTLLAATTNQICQEIAVVPVLWILPLCLYLATFAVFFRWPRLYNRAKLGTCMALIAIPQVAVLFAGARVPLGPQLGIYLLTLTIGCSICQGELALSIPQQHRQPLFFLCLAVGGALGTSLVAIVCPLLFVGYWEFHLSFWGCCFLLLRRAQKESASNRTNLLGSVGIVALAVILCGEALSGSRDVHRVRTFYGILQVSEAEDELGTYRRLGYGRIEHGRQYLSPETRSNPTLYFGSASGLPRAFEFQRQRQSGPLQVGAVGLGVGTIATYIERGERIRFYEINPQVIEIARRDFTFLPDCQGTWEIVLGDARVSLDKERHDKERTTSGKFNLLIVDAFRNDAIPTHLLTEECAQIYLDHLDESGLLMFHISNRYVDLLPVLRGIGSRFGLTVSMMKSSGNATRGESASEWVVLSRNDQFESRYRQPSEVAVADKDSPAAVLWTDDFISYWQLLRIYSITAK